MDVEVTYHEGDRVRAQAKDLVVEVGPPPGRGGDPDAYGPFDILLCGLATCTGYTVWDFLRERGFPCAESGLRIEAERDENTHLLANVVIEILVPEGFPAKYVEAIVRAAASCPVKDQLGLKPEFRVSVRPAG
jgi:putative redox protein